MGIEMIRLLYGYDRWINQRLLAAAEKVPPERTRESFGASFDTIHGTLAHILGSQVGWLSRWRGVTPTKRLGGADFADLAAIRARWGQHQLEVDAFMAELTPERLEGVLRYTDWMGRTFELPLWQVMLHVANHGTHHRSELCEMLTRVGHAPAPTDLSRYCLQKAGQE